MCSSSRDGLTAGYSEVAPWRRVPAFGNSKTNGTREGGKWKINFKYTSERRKEV